MIINEIEEEINSIRKNNPEGSDVKKYLKDIISSTPTTPSKK